MRLATFLYHNTPSLGIVRDNGIVPVPGLSMLDVIAAGETALADLSKIERSPVPLVPEHLLAPIPEPRRNIMCLGLNYVEHAKESAQARGREAKIPTHPLFFTKATNTVNGPYASILFDAAVSTQIDWEAELGVVIGQRGKNIPQTEAMSYVFGYTIVNDVSARDLQFNHGQFFKGKSLDGACPMGPWIVTADEIPDPHALAIRCRVNGVTKQEANTGMMIFKIPAIIEMLSRGMTLEAGDVIATGTPSGVGFARTPPEFLQPGDVVECEIEEIGVIRNRVG
ncbi:MAG: fumarylacetoacetate hydrolase family protein [Chloroflexota bacterium]